MTSFADRLLDWFDQHGRKHLPWQQDMSVYRVWISEIMLQQTQVNTVIPYFENFLRTFPTLVSLAEADQDVVLHHWTGLGYYARARNLHKTARVVVEQYNGEFPLTATELEALPGIGRSTAAAIVAICTNQRATILDGNVKRVLARHFGIFGWPGDTSVAKTMWQQAEALTPETRVADYTQAIMDLGATLCTRSSPRCEACPFTPECVAFNTNQQAALPGRKPKKDMPVRTTTMFILENDAGEYLLQQRPPSGIWGGLWGFPQDEPLEELLTRLQLRGLISQQEELASFRNTFTHFHLDITPVHVRLSPGIGEPVPVNGTCWYSSRSKTEIGLTRPVTRILGMLE